MTKFLEGVRDVDDAGAAAGSAAEAFEPPVEILESDDEVMLRLSVPGANGGDLRVFTAEDRVEVEGVIREPDFGRVLSSEMRYGTFRRSVPLPFPVDVERTVVVLMGGVLHVALRRPQYHS